MAASARLRYGEAILEGFEHLLSRYPEVFVIGQGLWSPWYVGNSMTDLDKKFGKHRIIDTPVSELACTGAGVGAALAGMRPIVVHPRIDFMLYAMDAVVHQAAKWSHMIGGQAHPSVVIRGIVNRGGEQGAQHSQSLHAWVSHIPGLKVALPSGPYEAKGLMKTAIRDDSPVVIFEDKMMYRVKGPVPEGDYTIPFGVAEVKRPGRDITIVATSSMVPVSLGAAKLLEEAGISAEVIDPRTTWPLDKQTLIDSAKKTSRAIVIDEGYERYGVTAEIASVIAEGAFYHLDAPVKRIGAMDVPVPFSPVLEDLTVPNEQSVFEAARALCRKA